MKSIMVIALAICFSMSTGVVKANSILAENSVEFTIDYDSHDLTFVTVDFYTSDFVLTDLCVYSSPFVLGEIAKAVLVSPTRSILEGFTNKNLLHKARDGI